jgi:hypothetical protein
MRRIPCEIDVARAANVFSWDRFQARQHRMTYVIVPIEIEFAIFT